MSLMDLSACELLQKFHSREASALEITQDALSRIQSRDSQVQAFLSRDEEGALAAAARIDRKRESGEPLGRLAGLPVAIKDNICVQGWKATCASRMLESFSPPYHAHVTERLQAEDAVLIGRTNLDEFAMGSSCENSAVQLTYNPWNLQCSPGGSSGGSAAAVAAGMTPLALGSDTGGSIRQPASFCGIVGLKPTYGRISRYGLIAFASSLDQIGPFSRTVSDAALMLDVLSGHDRRDSTSMNLPPAEAHRTIDSPVPGLKIGVLSTPLVVGADSEVEASVSAALQMYQNELGATLQEIQLPNLKYGIAAYYVIAPSEASSNLARYDGVHYGHRASSFSNLTEMYEASRGEGFGDEVKRRIMIGTYTLSSGYYDAYYLKAMQVRRLIADDFTRAFEQVDVIITPTSPSPAFQTGALKDDPVRMYLEDAYTVPVNLAGLPAISIPCGLTKAGLPIGLQLIAPAYQEERLLQAARMFEQATAWHQQRPATF